MSRIARAVLTEIPHHITQRGNARQVIFDSPGDRKLYLNLLRRNSERFGLSLWAYCLMSNHIHLVAVPHRSDSLSRALGRTHAEYAQYFNLRRCTSGHVWQARFFSCPLSGHYIWNAMAYVERNPVRASLTKRAADYEWSSARAHTHEDNLAGLLDLEPWRFHYNGRSWQAMIELGNAHPEVEDQLRDATKRGRPCADAKSIEAFERRVGRSLRPRPPGRPPKPQIEKADQLSFLSGQL